MATTCEESVTAGDFVTLSADPSGQPHRVYVKGSDAWAAVGPLSYRALVGSENMDLVPVSMVDGVLQVPPLPSTAERVFEVVDRTGEVLWADTPARDGDKLVLAIPPPHEVQLVVLDDHGKPLPGATILHHIRSYWFTNSPGVPDMDRFRPLWPICGVTDASGSLRVRVCVEPPDVNHPQPSMHFMARKPGYRTILSGVQDGKPYRNGRIGEQSGLQFTLAKVEPFRIKLQDSSSAPVKGSPAFFTWRIQVYTADGNGSTGLPFQELGRVGEGALSFDAPPPIDEEALETAWTVLPDAVRSAAAARGSVPPMLCRTEIVGTPAEGYQLHFPDDSSRRIQVADPDGRPAERAVVMVTPVVDGDPDTEHSRMVRTDRLGRALVGLKSNTCRIAVVTRTGAGAGVLKSDDKEPWRLQLGALAKVQGRMIDADGKPVAGGVIRISRCDGGSEEEGSITPRELNCLYEALPVMKSDAEGRFTLVYLRGERSLRFEADPLCRWQIKQQLPFPCTGQETEWVVRMSSSPGR
jgi:hypothetical protein